MPSFSLGGAADYGVLTNPSIHSFQSTSDSFYTGNIGIANIGGANQPSPPVQWAGSLTGNIDFAGLRNISNTNGISGTVNQNVAAVNADFNSMVTLSANLGAEAGTTLTLTGAPQTINASAGTLDANGNRVFTASSGFVPTAPLTINGSASDYVVINIPSGQTAKFSAAINLTGGITDDHVLYNVLGTGNEIGGAANGATVHGTILAINRKFNMDNVTVDGRDIGGDAADFQLVSNFRLVAPPAADLSLTKDDGVTSVVPGTSTTYTIVVGNAGPSAVTGASVSDPVPAGVTGASWTATGSSGGGSVTGPASGSGALATTVNLPAGATVTFTFTAQIDPSATGTLTNTATVTPPAGVTDTNPANNTASDTDTLTPQADLAITKTDGVTSAVPGTSTTYTIVVSNAGPSTAVAQAVTDNFPGAITAVGWTAVASAGSSVAAASGTGNIATTVTLLPGGTVTFTAVAQISSSANGSLTNSASVTVPPGDTTPDDNSASDTDTLTPQADLAITKYDGVTSAVPGTANTYHIVVSNLGPSAVTGASVSDPLPAGVTGANWTFVSATGGGSVTGPASGSGDLATTVDLPVNASVTFTFTAQIDPSATGTLTNTATVTAPAGVTDTNPANNSASDTDTLTPQADLAITKTDGVLSVVPGTSTTYTIVVSNAGPSTAVDQQVTDDFPAIITAVSWTAVASPGSSVAATSGSGNIATTVTLLPGGTVTFTAVAQISPSAQRQVVSLVNTATVAVPPGDTTPADNSATDTDSLTPLTGLVITKDDGQTTAVPGTSTTYTITVGNAGPSDAFGAALSDPLPAGVTAASWTFVRETGGGSVTGPTSGSGDLTTTVDLPVNATVTFSFTATIDPAATGTLVNTATVTPSGGTPIGATDTDTLTPQADLAVTKDDGKTTAVPGTANTYTITVSNAGPSTVTSVILTDVLPAALLNPVFGTPSAGTYDPATGIWSGLSLATGQSVTITLSGTIDPSVTGTLTNTAHVAPPAGVTDTNPANNSATDTDTLTPQADLSITKDDGVTSAVPGSSTTYTIVVSNLGPSAVSGASVSDPLPAGVTSGSWMFVSASGGGAVTGPASGTGVLATTVDLPVGATVTFTFTVQIDPSATGTLDNTATITPPTGVTDTNPANNSATDSDTLTPQADLAITKTDGLTSVVPGTPNSYIIVVSNLGPSAVTGASVSDPLPVGVTGASWTVSDSSSGGAVTGPASGSGALATTVDLPVNASVTFTFTVQIDPSATGTLTNTATVTAPAGVTDTNPANNSASDSDMLTPQADLAITKDDGVTSVAPGGSTTYTIMVTNAGPSTAVDQQVRDLFPASITAVSWTAVASTGSSVAQTSGSGNIITTVSLLPGGIVTFTAVGQITSSATGSLTNTATVAVPPGDTTPVDNSASDTDSLTPQTGLSITKDDGVTSVVPGTKTTYTIVVSNAGPSDVTGAALSDPLPAGVTAASWTFISATGGGSVTGPTSGSGDLTTTIDLPVNATVTFGYTATIDPAATASLVNTATVTPSGGTPIGDTDIDILTPQADLAVTKDDGVTTVVPGTANTYTITVSNNGPSTVSSVILTDAVPAALLNPTFGTPGAGTYDPASGVWSGLSLATGQSVTITLSGTIDPSATGTLTNTATVAPPAGVTDTNPGNNTASDTDTLTPQADLSITKDDGVTSVAPGSTTTYTIVVSNAGPSTVSGASVVDPLPVGVTSGSWMFVSATGGGAVTGPSGGSGALATSVNLPVGATVTFTFTVQIDPSATGSLTNTASVSAPAGVTDTNPANNSATDTDTLTPQADLSITKTDGVTSVVPGTPNTYIIVVSNLGPSAVSGASVSDPLPAGVTGASWTAVNSSGGGAVTGPASGSGALATTVDLPVNASVTFTFTVQIDPSATGTLDNTATVTAPAGVTDTNPANNSASDTDTLTPQADLAITKTDGVLSAVPGTSTTYTIVVSNAGPSTAVDQAVTDNFPAAITAVSWTAVASPGSSVAPASGSGNIATTVTLLPGGTGTFTAVANISSSATGTLTNTATVAVPPGDTSPADNSATDTDSLTPLTDLVITKDDGQTTAVPGTSTTYIITVGNAGPSDATGVSLSDPLPAGVTAASWTFISETGGGSVTGPASGTGALTTTVDLPAGATLTFSFTATIDPAATGTLVNTATVTPSGGTPTSATDTDTLTPQADLAVTKDDGQTSAVPGTAVTYTITVSNAGPTTVSSVTLTDAVPAALLNPVFGTPSAGSYDPATAIWSGLSLATGQSVTITLTGTVDPSATGTLTNTATVAPPSGVTDTNPANNTDSDTDTLTPQADLSITKTDNVTWAVPGSSTTYTIVVSNAGPSAVSGASVADPLPVGVTGGSWALAGVTGSGSVTGPASGTGVLATTVDLPVGASVTFSFTVQIDPAATTTLDNTATITAPTGVTDTNPGNNSATDSDTLTPQADLAITKTDGVTSVVPGTPDTYIIVVSNLGPSAVTGASVSDPLAAGVTSASWMATGSSGGGAVTGRASSGGALATTVDLPVNATVTFTFTVQIDPSATGTLDNTATVSAPAGVTDTNPANNSATDTDTLTPQADLAIAKTDGVLSAVPGTSTTYNIVVSNAGPSTAVDLAVTDNFPAGITAVSWTAVASPGSSVAAASGSGNIATTVTLLPGGTVTFTAVAQVSASATGSLTNTATVAVPPGDNTPADNSASDIDSLTPVTGLVITKDDGVTTVVPGSSTTYTILVTNAGPSAVSGAALADPLPAGVTAASWTFVSQTGGGSVTGPTSGSGALTTTVDLPAGASLTFGFTATVDPAATGTLVNTATVTPPGGMPTSGSDTDTLTPQADLAVSKTDGQTTAVPGTADTYTITVSNAGPSTVSSVTLTDAVPAALLNPVFGTPSAGSYDPATGVWSGLSLAAGQSVAITLSATVDPSATGTLTNTAHVAPPAGVVDTNPANNTDSDTDTLTPKADLSITKDDGVTSVAPGASTTYTIVVSNAGPSTAVAQAVTDLFPAAITAVSWTAVASAGSSVAAASGSGNIATAVTLLPGGTVTFTAVAQISASATGLLTNTATVAVPPGDTTPADNSASDTDTVTPMADLGVTKSVSDARPNVGDTITFTITLTDHGPNVATGVTVHDLLPVGLSFVSALVSAGSYDSGTGLWTAGTVAPGTPETLQIQARVVSPTSETNIASISHSDQVDNNPANNTASATVTPQQADLAVAKTVSNSAPHLGDIITFTITLTNNGPDAATGVQVSDPLPAGLFLVFAAPSQGTYNSGTGIWEVGAVADGAQAVLALQARVVSRAPKTNTAAISHADQFDSNPGNNQSSAVVTPPTEPIVPPTMIGKGGLLGTNPATAAAAAVFVNHLYQDLLGRAPDLPGLNFWYGELLAGVPRLVVAQGIWQSPEHYGREVDSFYQVFLHRSADPLGRQAWVNALLAGEGETDVEVQFITSDEYTAEHPDTASFATSLYYAVLGRTPSASEVAGWEQVVQNGASRSAVAVGFLTSPEADLRLLDEYYEGYLSRPPDPTGEQAWLALLESGALTPQGVGQAILASDEYFSRAP